MTGVRVRTYTTNTRLKSLEKETSALQLETHTLGTHTYTRTHTHTHTHTHTRGIHCSRDSRMSRPGVSSVFMKRAFGKMVYSLPLNSANFSNSSPRNMNTLFCEGVRV